MPSTKPFAFDVEKLNKFVNGDIGIADTIYKAQIAPILAAIPNPIDKEMFIKLSKPDKKSGIWALEKTVISSMLESQKPLIELIKICLELFGTIEYTIKVLIGGPNPENDPNSFSGAFATNKAKMSTFKTGMESAKTTTGPEPTPPQTIFLGNWRRDALFGNVYSLNSQPTNGEFTTGQYWPQYQDYNEFYTEENTKLQTDIVNVPADIKQDIIDGRFESIADEWSAMQTDNQLIKKYNTTFLSTINISKYYKPQEIQYLNKTVNIDIEEDYDITVVTTTSGVQQDFYIYATLKPDATGQAANQQAQPQFFPPPVSPGFNIIRTVKTFLKRVLPIIIKKLIPVITALQKLISKPVEFIGEILMTKLKEHFQMFDPSIKGTPDGDKYWSGDTFVMDGIAVLDVGLLKMTLGLKNGLPNFKVGKDKIAPDTKEQSILKTVANLAALPINFLKGILDAFKDLMKKLFKVQTLPQVFADFLTFKWIKDLLALPKLLEFLGAKNGDLSTIPFLSIPKVGAVQLVPDMIKAFLKMIIHFINGFIGIPNTILNMELVPKIPLPS